MNEPQIGDYFKSNGLPEICPCCGVEFIYDVAISDPPVVNLECECGSWLARWIPGETPDP